MLDTTIRIENCELVEDKMLDHMSRSQFMHACLTCCFRCIFFKFRSLGLAGGTGFRDGKFAPVRVGDALFDCDLLTRASF